MMIFDKIEKYAAYALLALMSVIVIAATLEVAYLIVTTIFEPPGFFIGVHDMFDLFGLFLMILIGLELMASIRMYVKDHSIHAEVMLLIALTAVTRKVVILDSKALDPWILLALAVIIVALTTGYYLIRRSRVPSSKEA